MALEYVGKEAPQEPRSKKGQTPPPWTINYIEELGGKFVDGAIVVGEGIGKGVYVILVIIAAILSIPFRVIPVLNKNE